MSKFRKIEILIIVLLIVVIAVSNVAYFLFGRSNYREYRVETQRVIGRMAEEDPEDISLSQYKYIVAIKPYDPENTPNNDYEIGEHDGRFYTVEYVRDKNDPIYIFDIAMGLMLVITIAVLLYVDKKVLRPFNNMTDLTVELAKGNLSGPVKAEKSKFFGKFLWGMDMLRENLEDNKRKELEYQKEKKTLVLSLSHDIKTPLSAIELYAKALKEGLYDSDEKKNAALDGILKNADEIKRYAGEITKISRDDFLNLKVEPSEFYLNEIMNSINVYYTDKLSVLRTEFKVNEYDNCLLQCDKDRLIEVLQNIIENAIKYGDGQKIEISFSDEEDFRLITIANSGEIPDETDMANLFDSFYRGKNTTGIKGSGLGLYIAKKLMQMMDGDCFVSSENGMFAVTAVVRKA